MRRRRNQTMDAELIIDAARQGERERLYSLAVEACRDQILPQLSEAGQRVFLGGLRSGLENWIGSEESWCLCAREGERILGFITLHRNGHLSHLFIRRDCQGRGLGRRLFVIAARLGCLQVSAITVRAAPPAVGFYEALGFHATGAEHVHNHIRFVPMRYRCTALT